MIGRHAVAAISAAASSVRHARALGIDRTEWARYVTKAVNCALCYVGFGVSGHMRESWQAGQAAFLSTAFDVATDWRHFDPAAVSAFEALLRATVADADTRRMAMDLLEAKRTRRLSDDGLERGVLALRLILRVMDCDAQRLAEWGDLTPVGQTLQLVDDLLDLDQDVARGEVNCLLSARGRCYLDTFLARCAAGEVHRWFGTRRTILVRVVERAVGRAMLLQRGLTPGTGV